ncbi:DUF4214 domain-containing protein [Synoicihabitans lomoniglobus]|uniref:DUF4214 domain-containing protein n=1 Tax=Synoicihabitans lomoniglobus TaxID=2909285 RepID=A0AAF0I7X2_9BACT|nr:DUF4214 domain-containing protein [Opitutaceae bacterium LMO-M01]WED67096.1 DUF4214 domain-containing protein [Opitutaceae bacterium LMO-M01]
MKPPRFSLLPLILGIIAPVVGSLSLSAQPDRSGPAVVLFSQPNFQGERIELEAGESIDDFNYQRFPSGRNANNRVSSIRIRGDVEVAIFDYRNFRGENLTLRDSVRNLGRIETANGAGNWNDELSSITVRERSSRHRGPDYGGRGDDRRDDRGHDDSRGDRRDDGRDDHRDSRRDRDHHREVVQVVQRAYLDILGRKADAEGLRNYVGIVEDRDWSEERLRNELRRSTEYRTVVVPRLVTTAYIEVLDRKPDAAGLRFYTSRMRDRQWTETRVREALRSSPEYRALQASPRQRATPVQAHPGNDHGPRQDKPRV